MDAGSEKLSGYADGANRFHDICFPCSTLSSSLHLYLYLSFILSLSFSFSFYFSFLLSSFPSQTRAYTLTSLSIQLFYDLSLSDTSISVLGHSYALRNHIFFVAPHPKIIGVVQLCIGEKKRKYRYVSYTTKMEGRCVVVMLRERRSEVLVISRLSRIACFLELCRSSRSLSISRRFLDLDCYTLTTNIPLLQVIDFGIQGT